MYFGSSVSSTESDINMYLAKAWTAIKRLLIIWKSDLSDKIKHNFFELRLSQFYYMDADKVYREKARQELHNNATSYIEPILEATSHKTAAVQSPTSYL